MKIDLYRIWELCNILSKKESELCEQNIFVHLMGHRSNYGETSFQEFLNYYSFRIEDDIVTVFNQDDIPYEDYRLDDFSYIPTVLLSFSPEKLENWMKIEIELQLESQKRQKEADKEYIKAQIERLQTQLNNS